MEETIEIQVGSHQLCHFSVNFNVLVRDLQPTATDKYRQGIVTKVLGPLTYKVCINGHTLDVKLTLTICCHAQLLLQMPPILVQTALCLHSIHQNQIRWITSAHFELTVLLNI